MTTQLPRLPVREVIGVSERLERGLPDQVDDILRTLRFVQDLSELNDAISRFGPELVKAALLAGVDQDDLVGKPYSATYVRRLARQAGFLPRTGGRRRRAVKE